MGNWVDRGGRDGLDHEQGKKGSEDAELCGLFCGIRRRCVDGWMSRSIGG